MQKLSLYAQPCKTLAQLTPNLHFLLFSLHFSSAPCVYLRMKHLLLPKSPFTTAIIAVLLCALIATSIVFACDLITNSTRAIGTHSPVVVIDAGHGGIDSGTTGVITGARESDLNLAISHELRSLLQGAGLNVVMTRETEDGLYGEFSPGFKRRDMERRAEIIKNAKPTVTVSIHMNKYGSPSRRGAQVYFQKGDDAGQALANVLQSTLNTELNLVEGGRAFSALSGDFYVCRASTPAPAVIVECGFLSNPEDDKLLSTTAYRTRVANAIKNGISEYLALMTVAP